MTLVFLKGHVCHQLLTLIFSKGLDVSTICDTHLISVKTKILKYIDCFAKKIENAKVSKTGV